MNNNKNAYAGRNIEILIKNSIKDHLSVIDKLKDKFKIQGDLENSAGGGIYGDKADVRINFTCGHYLDVNVKGFYEKSDFNQLTRTTVSKFCETFGLSFEDKAELEDIVVAKSKNTKAPLFAANQQKKWRKIFEDNAKKLLKWGLSKAVSREILALYNRGKSTVHIYAMKDVLGRLGTDITFTKGGVNIGKFVSFQRKGGNGSLSKHISKTAIQHPGNNVQLKMKPYRFIKEMNDILLASYNI